MASVAVNPPKTPVTKGSSGMATATLPNICKMPGPPAPFVPTPLPNIGQSGKQPSGYSETVQIEGNPVAIQGAMFGSSGDIASKASGGGIISSNAEGPTKFLGPGSLNVKIEGKNVQLLADPMLNNCGPSGSPPNSATMAGVMQQAATLGVLPQVEAICVVLCECVAAGGGQNCVSAALKAQDKALKGNSPIKAEVPYNMTTTPPSVMSYPGQRRPDCVIVNSVNGPPVGGNIAAIVEIKIPPDNWNPGQKEDYETIAGDPDKVLKLQPDDCDCPDDSPPGDPVLVDKKQEEEEKQLSFPDWFAPVAIGIGAVAAVAAIIIAAPAEIVIGGTVAAVAGVAALFSGPSTSTGPSGVPDA